MKSFHTLWIMMILPLFLVTCASAEEVWAQNVISDGNLVGIVFQNGVECLGEDAQPKEGDELFVSLEGDDSNPGTESAPLGTLAYALCNLVPGQTLNIAPGEYRESIILGAFGDSKSPIVIRANPEVDQRPLLEGESTRSIGIALVESTNIIVERLEFRNYLDEGLLILEGSNLILRNNKFTANGRASVDPDLDEEGFGVNVLGASDVLIEGNEAADNGPNQERWENFSLGTGINTYGNRDVIIRDNYVYSTVGGGILVEDSENVLVESNRIEDNQLDANGDWWDGGIWVDGGKNITLRSNEISNHNGPGIILSDEDVQYPDASFGYVLEENRISGNIVGIWMWNWGMCPVEESIITLNNNQLVGNEEGETWCTDWECGVGEPCE
ncbi:MAG: right-handed parallel beta-helix repeat-containing protein [Anaerolineales bacterium]|nr:right-handed parallel beta-helix repeat-containing protein [Chloroflexota bacterium]MBL6982014.1 right-handed parallel beta-helix repeat-containing protein [Anaerolineales bacterium]